MVDLLGGAAAPDLPRGLRRSEQILIDPGRCTGGHHSSSIRVHCSSLLHDREGVAGSGARGRSCRRIHRRWSGTCRGSPPSTPTARPKAAPAVTGSSPWPRAPRRTRIPVTNGTNQRLPVLMVMPILRGYERANRARRQQGRRDSVPTPSTPHLLLWGSMFNTCSELVDSPWNPEQATARHDGVAVDSGTCRAGTHHR